MSVPRERPPLPAGWRLRADPSTRLSATREVLIGGSPLRVLTLRPAGARLVAGWLAGTPVGADRGEGLLARRLLDSGLFHPDPGAGPALQALTVVVPVRDRPDQLRRCLASIDPRCSVVVVDDASEDGAALARVAADRGARLVRLAIGRGPSAARNAGLAAVVTPFVAFVDSDCVLPSGFPGRLLAHLGDPALAVVAPRIGALHEHRGLLASYEVHHSALDMGAREALVRPRTAISYVPGATLLARVAALGSGFDESFALGEDVDLLWRLHDAGWQSRYDPAVVVAHDHRLRLVPWFGRRVAYDRATAPLELRYPGNAPALSLSWTGVAFWTAVLAGRPGVAVGLDTVAALRVRSRLRGRAPAAGRLATRLVLQGHVHEARHVGRALTGPWLPLLLAVTARAPRLRGRLWAVVGAGVLHEWAGDRREPTPAHYAAPRAAADLARCAGVWAGCARHRTLRPLALRAS